MKRGLAAPFSLGEAALPSLTGPSPSFLLRGAGAVRIEVPGPAGSQSIDGSKFYDERYWDAKKYWAWQDAIWAKPRVGKVSVGEVEAVKNAAPSRIPGTEPDIDAPVPEVPEEPAVHAPTDTP